MLAAFAGQQGITFTLLSDAGSRVIRDLGLLNQHLAEMHGLHGGAVEERHLGTPYPGSFLLDERGVVVEKRFSQTYRQRETAFGILEQGFGVDGVAHGPEARAGSPGVAARAYLDSATYRAFQQLWLTVDLIVEPGLHVYAAPAPAGYQPLSVEVGAAPGLIVGSPDEGRPRPATLPLRLEGFVERLAVFEGRVTRSLPLVFSQEAGDQTIDVALRYQACDDALCQLPATLKLRLPVRWADLVGRSRPPAKGLDLPGAGEARRYDL